MKFSKFFSLLLFSGFFFSDAFGYIDPGTGSYIVQIVIAGLVGGIYALKTYWTQVGAFISRIMTRK